MNIKSLISTKHLTKLIHPFIYVIIVIFFIVLLIFMNNNVYKAINIKEDELRAKINESPKDINMKEFNEVIEKIDTKKTKNNLNLKEIF